MHGGWGEAEHKQADRSYFPEEATMNDERTSHVTSAVLANEKEGAALLEAIHELDRRLSDVLRPEQDSADKALTEPRPALVPLAERLTSHSGTVRMARQYVTSILERLEL